jgi:serine-type D-Ala-D-Ala carboxypeptidase (penicillin-binding protein 5/6)
VLTPRLISRNWRYRRCLALGLGAVTALTSAAVFVSAPAQAQEEPLGTVRTPAAVAAATAPSVSLRGGELVDATTGTVLWGKDITVGRPMGSITKVMTALLVLKAGDLGREIKVTKAAIRYVHKDGASSAGLIAGDYLTARQLLEAMLLPSGCDAAYLLATAYGPGRAAFVAKMNAMAQSLGMTSTHFSWFDGMPYPTETSTYSSPADLVRLGEAAMRNSVFRGIVAQKKYRLPATQLHHSYLWYTTDMLIGSYQGAIGIKTGDTKAAGNCLLFEARRNGVTLIGVVMHANPTSNGASAFPEATKLLNWGFGQA